MPRSQITEVRARTVLSARSQLTRVRAATVPVGRSQLTRVRARNVSSAHSQLTGVRAQNLSSSGPTVILTGPAAVEPREAFTLSLAGSSGGPFTGYQWSQLSGPPAELTPTGASCTVVAPVTKPSTVGWPNDGPVPMVFQGVVEKSGGAVVAAAEITVGVYPHTTWAADGSPLQWRLPTLMTFGSLNTNSVGSSATVLPTFRPGQAAAMQEWRWTDLQPNGPGTALDSTTVAAVQTKLTQFRTLGFSDVTVGMGLHYPPAWTFSQYPLGSANQDRIRFEGSDGTFGTTSSGGDMLDGVWSAVVRGWYEDFLDRMAQVVDFSQVDVFRITNGSRSELLYPENPATKYWAFADHVQNGGQYLADDQVPAPMTGWSPGSWTAVQKRAYVEWYHRSSVRRALWFMGKCRQYGFRGIFQIIMPGRGTTVTAMESDIAGTLPQSNTLARGVAWHLVADMLPADPQIMLWGSSVGQGTSSSRIPSDADFAFPVGSAQDSYGALRNIRYLANRYGYRAGGENPGYSSGIAADYNDTSSTGMMARAFDEIAPPGQRPVDRFDWAHGTNLGTTPALLAKYAALIATVNG